MRMILNEVDFTEFLSKIYEDEHTVEITEIYSHGKNFVKPTHLLNKLLKSWLDGKKFWWECKFFFIFPQCDKVEIS